MADYEEKDKDVTEDESPDNAETRATEIRKNWREAKQGQDEWRTEARRCFGFVAGHQWEEADAAKLEKEERPALTFNRTGAMVDSICGIEINNRQEVTYYPRTLEDARVNEIYTEAGKWARDNCNAADEESDAFRDAAICGVGLTETLMDYTQNLDGDLKIVRRDPLKAAWSPHATQKCNDDADKVYYADYMNRREVEKRWGVDVIYSGDVSESHTARQPDRTVIYDEESWSDDKEKNRVLVLHYQCYKLEERYRALDPFTGKEREWDKKGFESIKEKVKPLGMEFAEKPESQAQIKYVKQYKRVYYRGFYCGELELEYGLLPVQDGRGFTFRFITCKRDRIKNMWYGAVRSMMDPQKWGNKFLTLVVDIMARNAKGGAFAEEGSFKDPKKAEEDWGKSGSLITVNEGMLDKIRERQTTQYPAGWDRLMNFSFEAMHWVSGMNPEVLGMQEKTQAGVLEETRKRAAIAILAPLFDALKRYRTSQGYLMLAYIREFLTDGRIIRITGKKTDAKYIQLLKQEDTAEYDVVVDDAPTSPDFREKVWQGLQPLIPALVKQGVPIPPSVIEYAPGITSDVAGELSRAMAGTPDPQTQKKLQKMQQMIQALGEELQGEKEKALQAKLDKTLEVMQLERKSQAEQDKIMSKLTQNNTDATVERMNSILEAKTQEFTALLADETKNRQIFIDNWTKIQVAEIGAQAKAGEGGTSPSQQAQPRQINLLLGNDPDESRQAISALEQKVVQEIGNVRSFVEEQAKRRPKRTITSRASGNVYDVEET